MVGFSLLASKYFSCPSGRGVGRHRDQVIHSPGQCYTSRRSNTGAIPIAPSRNACPNKAMTIQAKGMRRASNALSGMEGAVPTLQA